MTTNGKSLSDWEIVHQHEARALKVVGCTDARISESIMEEIDASVKISEIANEVCNMMLDPMPGSVWERDDEVRTKVFFYGECVMRAAMLSMLEMDVCEEKMRVIRRSVGRITAALALLEAEM